MPGDELKPSKTLLGAIEHPDEVEAEPEEEVLLYRVILKNGHVFEALSDLVAEKLARTIKTYAKNDDFFLWSDNQATAAREIAHFEIVYEEEESEEKADEGVQTSPKSAESSSNVAPLKAS